MTVAVLHLRGWGRQNGSENMPRKSLAAGRDSPNSIRGADTYSRHEIQLLHAAAAPGQGQYSHVKACGICAFG